MTEKSVGELYHKYFPLIYAKCRRMLQSQMEAEDVAQETFKRLWSHRHRLKNSDHAATWLYRTSTRLAIDYLRRRRVTSLKAFDDHEPAGKEASGFRESNPERQVLFRDLLAKLIPQLPQRELEAILLSRVDGLSQREIGEVLGKSERTVRRLLRNVERRVGPFAEKVS